TRSRLRSSSLGLVSALALGASAPAATDPTHHGAEVAPWPDALNPDFGHLEVGDLDLDGFPDAVVRDGDELVFLPMVAVLTQRRMLVASGVVDFALLGDAGLVGGAEGIAVLTTAGLQVLRWSAAAGSFQTESSVGGAWVGATRLEAADWYQDVGQRTDLVGLASDGTTVLLRQRLAGGGWSAGTSFSLPQTGVQILPLQWDPLNSQLELAFSHANGIGVVNGSGTSLYTRNSSVAPGLLARVEDPTSTDDLVWAFEVSGTSFVSVTDSSGSVLQTVSVGGDGVTSVTACDLPGDDGKTDLLLTFAQSHDTLLLRHSGSSPNVYSLAPPSVWIDTSTNLYSAGTYGLVTPACAADFDNDGVTDLLIPSAAYHGVGLFRGPIASAPTSTSPRVALNSASVCLVDGSFEKPLILEFAVNYVMPEPPQGDEYEMISVVFQRDDDQSYTTAQAISRCDALVAGTDVYTSQSQLAEPTAVSRWDAGDVRQFYVMVYPVDLNGRAVAPATVGAFTIDSPSFDAQDLTDPWTEFQLLESEDFVGCGGEGGPGTGTVVSAFGQMARIPPISPTETLSTQAGCTLSGQ
ncbi:MAG TPA: hypothetical protein VMT18_12520, partial [Planctomycetota bacterium]|nr:hypothetical protein [Planctomycetota bacterium]